MIILRKAPVMKAFISIILTCLTTTAFAQTAQEWRATLLLEAGNATTCLNGVKGTISIKKNVLSWIPNGWAFPGMSIPLAADGSGDLVVPVHRAGTSRVNVPSGSGPRAINSVNQSNGCRYRYVPD